MFKATVDEIVFETDTAQDLGVAVATYKNGLVKQEAQVVSNTSPNTSVTI